MEPIEKLVPHLKTPPKSTAQAAISPWAEEVKQQLQQSPILMTLNEDFSLCEQMCQTLLQQESFKQEGIKAGMNRIYSKPFYLKDLNEVLE